MKKNVLAILIIFFLVVLPVVNTTISGAFAIIGRTGLSFLSPETAQVVNNVICISNPILCLQGKIVGTVTGELYQEIARQSPEAARAMVTYNQINSYIQTGSSIVQELKVDEEGYVTEGSIDFIQSNQIGNLVGKGIKKEDVVLANAQFRKQGGVSTFILKQGGSLQIKTTDLETGQIKGRHYGNIIQGGILKVNERGEVTEADITSNELGSTFSFGDKVVKVSSNTRVTFVNGQIKVYGNGKSFELSNFRDQLGTKSSITILEGESVTIIDNRIIGKNFGGEGFKVKGLGNGFGEVTFSEGRIIKVKQGTDATINGIQHRTFGNDLNVYYNEYFDFLSHRDENYFNYGKSQVHLGGSGFTSSLTEGNKMFPEYIQNKYEGTFTERQGRLEFTPQGGHLEVTKVSPDNSPLALNIKATGKLSMGNGKWDMIADGKNIYAKTLDKPQYPISSDMRFDYIDDEGVNNVYDLDVKSTYTKPMTEEDKIRLIREVAELETFVENGENEIIGTEFEEVYFNLENIDKKRLGLRRNIIKLQQELIEAREQGDEIRIAEIGEDINRYEDEVWTLGVQKRRIFTRGDLRENVLELMLIKKKIEKYKIILEKNLPLEREGVFAQVVTSPGGDSRATYSGYVQGIPVIKNTDVKVYYGKKKVEGLIPGRRVTVSGTRLPEPEIFEENRDVIPLIVNSKYQTCADTQIELRLQWELEQLRRGRIDRIKFPVDKERILEYRRDGSYTMIDSNTGQVIEKPAEGLGRGFESWVTNIEAYTNTGSLRSALSSVTELDDLKPGDIITLHPDPASGYGHTLAIKEILEIPPGSGDIHYRLFAGSDPAIDPRIYPSLLSRADLIDQITEGDAVPLSWERRGG